MTFTTRIFSFTYLPLTYSRIFLHVRRNLVFSKPVLIIKQNMSFDSFKYEPGSSSVAFVTAPDREISKKLANGLVEKKLAACVNILPNIQSVYMWEGKLNEDDEYLLIIKTRTSRIEEMTKWVRDNHPYSVAEVVTIPIEQGNIPYMKWLSETVLEKD